MNAKQIVKKLEKEIKGKNRKDAIEILEEQLIKNVEKLSKNENFFNLPLNNILSVISKVDFNEIDEITEILHNIIKNIIKAHSKEKETILILQNLNITTISFSHEEIFSILELITNCPILVKYCNLYKEQNKEVDIDYEYEIQQKDKEIEKLRQQMSKKFMPITQKPIDYEPDIFVACQKGKLTSVRWLIEKEKEDKNKKIESNEDLEIFYMYFEEGDTPIHIASRSGHLQIVEYLIERQNVDTDIKGWCEKTPLHYACQEGHLSIVDYNCI